MARKVAKLTVWKESSPHSGAYIKFADAPIAYGTNLPNGQCRAPESRVHYTTGATYKLIGQAGIIYSYGPVELKVTYWPHP